jgi:hypothetical protein
MDCGYQDGGGNQKMVKEGMDGFHGIRLLMV